MLAALALALTIETPTLPFAERYDAAFAEATARNVPVLIIDFDGWTQDQSQGQPTAFYADKEFLAQCDGCVLLLAGQEDHGSRPQQVDGTQKDVCKAFGGVPCDVHRDLLPKVFGDFGRDGALVSPLFVVASPDRKELTRLEHEHPPVELTLALKTAAKKLGAGMGRAAYRQVTSGLAQLRRLIDLNEFAAATVLLESLKKVPGNFAPNAEVKVAEQHLDEAGRGQIKRARELWAAQRLLDGLIAIDDVKASFGKLACAGTAASLLAEWEKSPAAATSLQDLKVHRGARQLYFQAVEQEQAGDRKKAIQTLDKLLRQFPESRFTDRGRAMRDGLVGG